jgi:hypothetical protein
MRLSSPSGLTGRLLRRYLLGGGRRWQLALAVVLLGRLLQRATKLGTAPVAFEQSLKPGEGLLVTHLPVSSADTSGTSVANGRRSDAR